MGGCTITAARSLELLLPVCSIFRKRMPCTTTSRALSGGERSPDEKHSALVSIFFPYEPAGEVEDALDSFSTRPQIDDLWCNDVRMPWRSLYEPVADPSLQKSTLVVEFAEPTMNHL